MIKTFSFIAAIAVLFLACRTKKSSIANTKPNEAQLSVVTAKVPGTTLSELNKGHEIYYGACTNCHGPKDVTKFNEEQLKSVIDKMAPKARLTAEEKDAVWKYALSVNLSSSR